MELGILHHSTTFGVGGKLEVEEHLELEGLVRYEWMQDMIVRLSIKHSALVSGSKGQDSPVGSVGIMAMLAVERMQASCH